MKLNQRLGATTVVAAAALLAGCGQLPAPATADMVGASGHAVDHAVASRVRDSLQRAGILQGSHIEVASLNGDLRLSGALESRAQIDEAIRLARAHRGVHAIHDELTVRTAR